MSLQGKHILLGVTGGIAAYKACELLRLLVKAGADVEVMMTKAAAQFVGPLTFETLSGKPVAEDMWDPKMRLPHISLRKNKDLIVVAPATANIIAKAANGIADDLVSSTLEKSGDGSKRSNPKRGWRSVFRSGSRQPGLRRCR